MSNADYSIAVRPLSVDEGGGWFAEVAELPGCISDGDTREEAVANVREAIGEWTACAVRLGRKVPHPQRQYA